MKTVICKPNTKIQCYQGLKDLSACEMPLWISILANYYHSDCIIDAEADGLTSAQTVEQILSQKPRRVVILACGNHPSAFIQQKGEMLKLNIMLQGKVEELICLDKLPVDVINLGHPKLELLDMNKYRAHNWQCWGGIKRNPYGVVYTSVGCPFKCNFCTIHSYYATAYKQRAVSDIIFDFDSFYKLGVRNIKIMDELFTSNPTRVEFICSKIADMGANFNIWSYARIDIVTPKMLSSMKKAGINWISYGIEVGDENIRKNILKGNFDNKKVKEIIKLTKDSGINCLGNYMFGFWEEGKDELQRTLDLAMELQCEYSNLYCLTAYPGTSLYAELMSKGLQPPTDYTQYAQMAKSFKPLDTKYLNGAEVLRFRDNAFNTYFSNKSYQKMMKKRFGPEVKKEIKSMLDVKVERNYV